jgi:hypothetical protein
MTQQQKQITALQLWNEAIKECIYGSLRLPKSGKTHLALSILDARMKDIVMSVQKFEVTKHRTLVDKIVAAADATNRERKKLSERLQQTQWFMFLRRRRLSLSLAECDLIDNAYKTCLLIVVNTPPPPMAVDGTEVNTQIRG